MFEHFGPSARDAVSTAQMIAELTGAPSVRQEHIAAACVAKLRGEPVGSKLQFTNGAQRLLEDAYRIMRRSRARVPKGQLRMVTADHLLAAYQRGLRRQTGR